MKTYIAGKVTGEPIAQCSMKFGQAQKRLEDQGYIVVNPLEVVNDWQCPWRKAMKLCITALMDCDTVHLLPDWEKSRGARLEEAIAQGLNLRIYYL